MAGKKDPALVERNKEIYRLKMEDGLTHDAISKRFGITKQRVHQILLTFPGYMNVTAYDRWKVQIYDFIVNYKLEHDGCAPASYEICAGCSMLSNWDVVNRVILKMIKENLLRKSSASIRTIEVVGGSWTPPPNPFAEETI